MRRDAIRRARTSSEGQKPAITPDFSEILAALKELASAGEAADRAADAAAKSGDAAAISRVNDTLTQVERAFLDPKGLPNRPWFRHMLIAPGLTTGYAPWPFPALAAGHRSARRDDVHDRSRSASSPRFVPAMTAFDRWPQG